MEFQTALQKIFWYKMVEFFFDKTLNKKVDFENTFTRAKSGKKYQSFTGIKYYSECRVLRKIEL